MAWLLEILKTPVVSGLAGALGGAFITILGQYFLKRFENDSANKNLIRSKLEGIYYLTIEFEKWVYDPSFRSTNPNPILMITMMISLYVPEFRCIQQKLEQLDFAHATKKASLCEELKGGMMSSKKWEEELLPEEKSLTECLWSLRDKVREKMENLL